MAVPSSGQLRLRGDLALEVNGSASGTNVSLSDVSESAGLSAPHNMSELYGYVSAVLATLTTNGTGYVYDTLMSVYGNVLNTGGGTVSQKGFYFGTDSRSPYYNTRTVTYVGGQTGVWGKEFNGLTKGRTYYWWAFAVNEAGEAVGSRQSAVALTPYSPSYQDIYNVDFNYQSNGGSSVTYQGLRQYINPQTNAAVTYSSVSASTGADSSDSYQWYEFSGSKNHKAVTNGINRYISIINKAPIGNNGWQVYLGVGCQPYSSRGQLTNRSYGYYTPNLNTIQAQSNAWSNLYVRRYKGYWTSYEATPMQVSIEFTYTPN